LADAAVSPPPPKNVKALRRLMPFLRPYGGQIAIASLALLVAAGTVLGLGQGLKMLVDNGLASRDTGLLNQALLALLAVITLLAAATYVRFLLVSQIGEKVVADIRKAVFNRVLGLDATFFETAKTGAVISRLTTDTTLLQTVIGSTISFALRNLITVVGGVVMLAVTSPRLSGMVLLVVPLVVLPLVLFGRRVRSLSRDSQDRVADVGAFVDETLHGVSTVQAFGHEAPSRALFADAADRAYEVAVRRIKARAWLIALVIFIVFGAIGFVLWTGGRDVIAGRMSGGELAAFVFYAVVVASGFGALSEVFGELARAGGATERLFELLDTVPAIQAPPNPQPLPSPPVGEVAYRQVRFSYPSRPGVNALDSVSLTIRPGEKVALVGPSGAGKSTMLQLLLRFYDPQGGAILLDGVDIAAADPAAVRARLALVPQDPVIFSASARENIRFGRPAASDAEVEAAARAAYAHDFVVAMPQGYDTPLGERGARLSGGQRQRIAIARALLRDAPVLLLDEATSALDAESEQAVQRALETLMRNRTTLIIAHRLATVQHADRIVVLDGGRIVAEGTHADLVAQGGLYARLASLQFDVGSLKTAAD
jgi:ATP-binding cassette subfamily B protein